jgi:hypothetical protein
MQARVRWGAVGKVPVRATRWPPTQLTGVCRNIHRYDWLIDISPLAETSASYKQMLDVEYFTQRTFPLCNPYLSW